MIISEKYIKVSENDYVILTGLIIDSQKNTYGDAQYLPYISVDSLQLSNYAEVCAPTLKTIEVNDKYEQNGYAVTIEKVELSEKETRVYVGVENNGSDEFSLQTYRSLIVQNGRQFDYQSNYEANYPEIQTDLRVGNKTNGIITFPKIDDSSFEIILFGYSDNYQENFDDYSYSINN